jgi:NADH:ubiquinone oxidoreductase subunit 6 (subunit J)
MIIDIVLIVALVLAALMAVITARLLASAVWLAVASGIVAALMFRLNSPWAGVFELSVCAGLIPAIFISAIGLTARLTPEQAARRWKHKLVKYGPLPVIVALTALAMWLWPMSLNMAAPPAPAEQDVRNVLWNLRHLDLVGQATILAAGAFAVVVLVKGAGNER